MATHLEKLQFSERLHQSFSAANIATNSPTALTRRFNLLSPQAQISVQAVRRWLEGTAIPSQDKLVVLARWLKVSPEWLRYGDTSSKHLKSKTHTHERPAEYDALALVTMIELLSEENRQAVSRIINALLESEGKVVRPTNS